MQVKGKIYGINGPVIYLLGDIGFKMSEMVYVGEEKLVGEVISLSKKRTTIQVFEETTGLRPGEVVEGTGSAISVTLAPGILNNIFDGIERPLQEIAKNAGAFIRLQLGVDIVGHGHSAGLYNTSCQICLEKQAWCQMALLHMAVAGCKIIAALFAAKPVQYLQFHQPDP